MKLAPSLTTIALVLAAGSAAAAAEKLTPSGPATANPALWPKAHSPAAITDAKTEAFITDLMSKMSIEEKVGQLVQADIGWIKPEDLRKYPLGSILAGGNSAPDANERAAPQRWVEFLREFRAVALEKRDGHVPIPIMFGIDAVHGHNNVVGATVFPHNIGLGAARDPELIGRIGKATAEEVAVTGADWTFGPTLAVPRDDRWGRAYEGYGENPEIVRSYAGPMTLGLQGKLVAGQSLAKGHIPGSAKHFLADGGTKDGKDQGDFVGTEAELIRDHVQGYVPAINEGVLTVMVSFSSWNGVKHTGNKSLLTDVLQKQMGFEGFTVGDWNAHGQVAGCTTTNCPQAINAGLDMFMAPDSWKELYDNTLAQAKSGEISMARIDDAVRRIIRVKVKSGLFDAGHYDGVEGKFDRLAAPEHRAIAREAVRKSLVLLKNNGGVLPLKANARILVAGDGADNIGKQSGGWTIDWQGAANTNTDFPQGQSIFGGIAEAAKAAGGSAELSVDGAFKTKPDVAVVVFGENPYAEFQGDIATLDYQPGDARDLALLKKLKAQGIPVVSVFLSGRPLWTNPEINASDAFVAAWLPGTEGGGVADVLLRKPDGAVNHDFRGKLSFSWPKTAAQIPNVGEPGYDPQFAYGYGLTYASKATVAKLSEVSGVPDVKINTDAYFDAGRVMTPWIVQIGDPSGLATANAVGATKSPGGLSEIKPVDGAAQESARGVTFEGPGEGRLVLAGPPVDLTRQANGDLALAITWRQDAKPEGKVVVGMGCGDNCGAGFDFTAAAKAAPVGQWTTTAIKLSCFRDIGLDVSKVSTPLFVNAEGKFAFSFSKIALAPSPGGVACPTR